MDVKERIILLHCGLAELSAQDHRAEAHEEKSIPYYRISINFDGQMSDGDFVAYYDSLVEVYYSKANELKNLDQSFDLAQLKFHTLIKLNINLASNF